jgi:putative sterol carrier protein
MSELESRLRQKVKLISEDKKQLDKVERWVDGYFGKIVSFHTSNESWYLTFSMGGVTLGKGDYPSCEVSYRGNKETLLSVLEGKVRASQAFKLSELKVWGSMNEAVQFEALLSATV